MRMISSQVRRVSHDEAGITLIELLVSIIGGVFVTGALFSLLVVSLHQTSRISDRVQATQSGRYAMTSVVNELHSACLAREFTPVQAKSGEHELRFTAGFSEKAVPEFKEVSRHKIAWTGTYPSFGKLIDYTYPATSGTWPSKFVFEEAVASPAAGVMLAENIYQVSSTMPVFQYYKYATTASPGTAESASGALTPVVPPSAGFNATEAKSIAAVRMSYLAAPRDNYLVSGRQVQFSTLVTLAFAAPSSEATITDGPCQ
jgi:Tfp pilus assembly protein PilW